jgi:hypothetical protein
LAYLSGIKGNKGVKQLIGDKSFGKHLLFRSTDKNLVAKIVEKDEKIEVTYGRK